MRIWLGLLLMLAVAYSCKMDILADVEDTAARNREEFFRQKNKGSANTRSGVDYVELLRQYDLQTNFTGTMADQQGLPIWEKMQILDHDSITSLYIPLSEDNLQLSSLLLVNVDASLSVKALRNFTNDYLKSFVYDTEYPTAKRQFLMDTFIQMDFLTFNQKNFTNLPSDLYSGSTVYNTIYVEEVFPQNQINGKFIYGTFCIQVLYCPHGYGAGCHVFETNGCNHSAQDGICFVFKKCTSIAEWVDDPSGFPAGGGGDGGGGGCFGCNPAPLPNPDPCSPQTENGAFYRIVSGCGGGGGEEQIEQDPCEKTKALLAKPKVQQGIAGLRNFLGTPAAEKNETGFKEQNDGEIIPTTGGEFSNNSGPAMGHKGGYHTHPNTTGSIHIFSPRDITRLLDYSLVQQPSSAYGNGYVGMIAKEPCSSCPNGIKYVHYVIRFTGTQQQLQGINFSNFINITQLISNNQTITDAALKDSFSNNPANGFLNEQGREKLFFETLIEMGLQGLITLQRIESDGSIKNITQNSDGTINNPNTCP